MRLLSSLCGTGSLRRIGLVALGLASLAAVEREAHATNVLEFPDNGSEQVGRGGAWIARASDPLATFFNPAGLAGQRSALTIQANVSMLDTCFTRLKHADDASQEPLADPATGLFPKVCNYGRPFPNPQLAGVLRVSDRVGIGLAVLGPSAVGGKQWPTFVENEAGPQPAPQRYLLLHGNMLLINPTVGVGAEVVDNLRLGVAFHWGILKAKFVNAASGLNADNQSPSANDLAATLIASDYFIPAATAGGIYTVGDMFDIAATYKVSDAIRASGNVYTQANYFTRRVAEGDPSGIADGDSSLANCNVPGGDEKCRPGLGTLRVNLPMEAKIAFRFHKPRRVVTASADPEVAALAAERQRHVRDPIATDLFDAELDLTWSNNSVIDSLQIRFPGDEQGNGVIPVNGTPGSLPPVADVPKRFKDVFGIRAGGDVNILPNRFAVRGGAFYETRGQDVHYQNIDFPGGARFGLAAGLTYRLNLQGAKDSLDFHLGYMHAFYATQQNDDPNGYGVNGLAGTACNPVGNNQAGGTCADGSQKYRTNWPVNLGTISNALNVINVGASYRF